MKKVIRLTESDLKRIVIRVLNEDVGDTVNYDSLETGKFYKNENYLTKILYVQNYKCYLYSLKEKKYLGGGDNKVTLKLSYFKNYGETFTEITEDEYKNLILTPENTSVTYAKGKTVKYNELEDDKYYKNENYVINMLIEAFYTCYMFSIKDKKYLGYGTDKKSYKNIGDFNVYGETFTEITEDEYKKTIFTLLPSDKPTPNNNTTPKPNDEVIPKPTLNNNNTTPTGVVDSDSNFVLDENVFLGVLGDGEYIFYGEPLENDGKTKKIPDGSGYYLALKKTLNGYKVSIGSGEALTIKDGILNGTTWGNLFSKINNVSMTNPNDLLSNEDDIFQSLLEGTVPSFEIDKEKEHKIKYDDKTGAVNVFILYLKSKFNKKITSVRLTLDKFDKVNALVNGKMVNTIWDGNDLKFKKSKKQELIIKVNENVRKALKTYFYG
jgi:hypothetical protein